MRPAGSEEFDKLVRQRRRRVSDSGARRCCGDGRPAVDDPVPRQADPTTGQVTDERIPGDLIEGNTIAQGHLGIIVMMGMGTYPNYQPQIAAMIAVVGVVKR
jgi:hypothetical protein